MDIYKTVHQTHLYNSFKEASQFAKTIPDETWDKMSKLLFCNSTSKSVNDTRIGRVDKNIFQKGQIFYHGEKLNKKTKTYIFDNDRIIFEEMGDGLYITPNRKVAAFWAGIKGQIFKLKLNTDKIAQVNQKQIEKMVSVIANNVKKRDSNFTGQDFNIIIRTLFQKNGYDAAFSHKSMSNGFKNAGTFFDTIIGEPQQQLAIYNDDVIEVLPKNLLERCSNQMLQIKSYIQYYKNLLKYMKENNINT